MSLRSIPEASRSADDVTDLAAPRLLGQRSHAATGSAGSANHVILHRVGFPPFSAILSWGNYAQLVTEIARTYQLSPASIVYVHEMQVDPTGTPPGTSPLIVQFFDGPTLRFMHTVILFGVGQGLRGKEESMPCSS